MFRLVTDELSRLSSTVRACVAGLGSVDDQADVVQRFSYVAHQMGLAGAAAEDHLQAFLAPPGQERLLEILEDLRVIVVNSDSSGPTVDAPRPTSQQDYEQHRAWILIGGDILGRGVTIPQLTVTYFLRQSTTPNFDTVLQQLRFCGYRHEYRKWLAIYAPRQSFEDLRYMEIVDRVVWERAVAWDHQSRHLGEPAPSIFYVSPVGARFEPTRAAVRDPDITDRRVGRDNLFALRDIFDPADFRTNLANLRRWVEEFDLAPNESTDSWLRFDDLSDAALRRLLLGWEGDLRERGMLEAVAEVIEPQLGELGLSEVPSVVYVSRVLAKSWADPVRLQELLSEINVTRSVSQPEAEVATLDSWFSHFERYEHQRPTGRPVLRVPHIGDGQRLLGEQLDYSAVVFILEPILGVTQSRDRRSAIALGLGFAALSPDNFHLRTMGHS